MNVRRLAVAASVALGLLASSAQAGGNVTLDGTRRTHIRYSGGLTEPALKVDTSRIRTDVNPDRADCTKASCDVTNLRLVLPAGTTAGRFQVVVRAQRELNVAIFLYDAAGNPVGEADVDQFDGTLPECCTAPPSNEYTRGFSKVRLPAGKYTLVIYDRFGAGGFVADVDYRAHPPDRPRKGTPPPR